MKTYSVTLTMQLNALTDKHAAHPELIIREEIVGWFDSIDWSILTLAVIAGDAHAGRRGVIRRLEKAIDELRSWDQQL